MDRGSRTANAEELARLREAIVDLGCVVGEVIVALHQAQVVGMQLQTAILTRGSDEAAFRRAVAGLDESHALMKAQLEKAFAAVAAVFKELGAEEDARA
jgi:hypothetical protein